MRSLATCYHNAPPPPIHPHTHTHVQVLHLNWCTHSLEPVSQSASQQLAQQPHSVLERGLIQAAYSQRGMSCCPLRNLLLCAGSSHDCGGEVLVDKSLQLVGNLVVV
jgi:hypothetical protein